MRKVVKRGKITKGEKLLYSLSIISFCITFVLQIFCGATLGNLSITTEKYKSKIVEQEKTNESLAMQVNELTSFDHVKDIVKDMGLAYNNDNIVVVNR
ncbi:MAG: hypothetical protein NC181_05570 [Clostridium sp.]|nr:hypothetical protein [Clostridium sp.]MCM1444722.1 hypothetical protein [Candidatus Amulumruptor caecigallinarius]